MDDPIVRIVLPIPTNMVKDALTQRELLLRVVQSLFEVKDLTKHAILTTLVNNSSIALMRQKT